MIYEKVVFPYSEMIYPKEFSQNGATGPNYNATGSSKGWENTQYHEPDYPYVGK